MQNFPVLYADRGLRPFLLDVLRTQALLAFGYARNFEMVAASTDREYESRATVE